MSWAEAIGPVRMCRVALVAPGESLPAALRVVGSAGAVEFDAAGNGSPPAAGGDPAAGADPLGTEAAQVRWYAGRASRDGAVAALLGWCPANRLAALSDPLAATGAALVPLPTPSGQDPPTLLRTGGTLRRSFSPLVRTYGTVAYVDVDPTLFAGVAYVVMFGIMFADAGHGALLLLAGLLLWLLPGPSRPAVRPGWQRLRQLWLFVAGAGLASTAFGVLFGEFFGPTPVLGVRWLDPLGQPVLLLSAGVALGALLLAIAYGIAVVNRWREGGARLAVYAPSGIAGAAAFAGLGALSSGLYFDSAALAGAGAALAGVGLALAGIGLYVAAGGGATGTIQAVVQLFDLVLRLGANLVSFARLAAFGLTHAALGALVWSASSALTGRGALGVAGAVVVFALGNALAFGLEALVAAIQALRLEYYELFSRIFEAEGRPFRPWLLATTQGGAT